MQRGDKLEALAAELDMLELLQAERERIAAEANAARSEKAKGNRNAAKDKTENSPGTNSAGTERDHKSENARKSATRPNAASGSLDVGRGWRA